MKVSKSIKDLRERLRVTQEELVEKMSVNLETVLMWEKDQLVPTQKEFELFKKLFNLSLNTIKAERQEVRDTLLSTDSVNIMQQGKTSWDSETSNNLYNLEQKKKSYKTRSIIFIVLSLILIFIGAFVILLASYLTNMEFAQCTWALYFLLPIPIILICIGYYGKRNRFKYWFNLLIGYYVAFMLAIIGSLSFGYKSIYTHDYSYVSYVEEKLSIDLPDTGTISTREPFNNNNDEVTFINESNVLFTDNNEILVFENSFNIDIRWKSILSNNIRGLLPYNLFFDLSVDNYYMIYNVTLDTYNNMPEVSGEYYLFYLCYNSKEDKLRILEYYITVIID